MAKKKTESIRAHPHVKQILSEQEKIEKKSFLDKPIKDIFSFNVDRTIKDTADRSRGVSSKILRDLSGASAIKNDRDRLTYVREHLDKYRTVKKKYRTVLTSLYVLLIFCIVASILLPTPLTLGINFILAVVIIIIYIKQKFA